ncbi:hypothetical protein MCOR25_010839 [Pyricularia grisea]|nr:hypothetical protein MCOR25_010839 [Pyricularia grisea]
MNAILDERNDRPTGLQDLSEDDIKPMFLRVQTARASRSRMVVTGQRFLRSFERVDESKSDIVSRG